LLRFASLFLLALAAGAQDQGWKDIFPDAQFSQWTRVTVPPGKTPTEPSQWRIDRQAGTLVCEGNGGHEMLRYNTEFSDFEFHVEWKYTKVADEKARYNSGVYVRNNADGSIWHQAQAGQAGAYLFGGSEKDGKPVRVNLREKMVENRVKPVGEWNAFDITAKGKTITLAVNGKVVSEWTECEVPKGYVALEAEGFRIEFRNIKVRPLGR
jgi:hypothetical protein